MSNPNSNPCLKCGGIVDRSKPKAHNKKYCSDTCRNEAYIDSGRYKSQYQKYFQKNSGKYAPDKRQCPYCDKWYKALAHHTWQAHEISARQLKEELNIPYKRGLIPDELKKHKAMVISSEIIKNNLLRSGQKTRFIKGDSRTKVNTYERLSAKKKSPRV